jgi:tRNA(Ser,Leu) C12 N-acetylase TAN1
MKDWNVVVSLYQDGFRHALRMLRQFGAVERSGYYNVVVMKVEDPRALLDTLEAKTKEIPALYDTISRVAPAERSFEFESAEAFVENAKSILLDWLPQLAGRSFHVRLHRRGGRHDLPSPEIERALDDALLEASSKLGAPGRLSFTDPDLVIAIDTVDHRAGIGFWSRDDLARHHLLRPD